MLVSKKKTIEFLLPYGSFLETNILLALTLNTLLDTMIMISLDHYA